ncbi:zinc ribbon domain-containing protein [Thermodesulforhabdus norvegica]|uniref:Zinc-ribbon family protein n=1 Tax=Thermodesulforhabdus norvegica TaxID=39841 RepID=A0A1I4R276_9BACT|nr:zinc ribbon domain-containing protein [Thermodesulforhabdus norvegica]SFM46205.1 zinc-ribbon family protein [Thermodesulforhabdus norvegica]
MFFFIGGVQPKTVTLDENPRLCPSCGLAQAKLKRIDHYVSLFFIPLFPVKKGEPLLMCERCGFAAPPDQADYFARSRQFHRRPQCPSCGLELDPSFNYCPRCGTKV